MEDNLYLVAFGIWGLMASISYIIEGNADPKKKKRWRILLSLANGAVFIVFSQVFVPGWESLAFVTAGVALYVFVNIRFTTFCPSCGHAMNSLSKQASCPSCGKRV